jgi:hypothetical protein
VVLGQMVAIKEDGVERRVTAAEAFLLYMTKRGLEGDGTAARSAMAVIEEARSARHADAGAYPKSIEITFVTPGSVDPALLRLRMASKLDRFRPRARILLEPWLVQEALSRLANRRLSPDEQAKVVKATRTPHKVRWPEWWTMRP